jgi:predicted helicase
MTPEIRKLYGVYATPRPLVGFMVRSVHLLLQTRLGMLGGLADPEVRLLDPAAGTGNFLRAAGWKAIEHHMSRGGDPREIVDDHLLPHFHGFEILPEIHARGLASLRRCLRGLGAGQETEPRLAQANALEPPRELLEIPFNVILGNPPWRGASIHRGRWISELLREVQPQGERNTKWLQDDYVKFLRLAQWRIDQTGEGIVALVVNHNCLDGITFRELRASLLRTFDEIYVLDLHGNRRKRERAPDGSSDENVFPGIAQGAAVLFLIKRPRIPAQSSSSSSSTTSRTTRTIGR